MKSHVKAKAVRDPRPGELEKEWQNLLENASDAQTWPYDQSASYQVKQAIDHPTYGLGFVRSIIGSSKMEVAFRQEVKLLVMNRVRASQGGSHG
ncbi:MAG: hypothetical protein JSU72_09880 [Deltaproteobacteria bacterium]|nr:MAG: hypothetical protein JSU72_09880 [Deltaproteobacteria bacterium]